MPKITGATGPKWVPAAVFLYLIAHNFPTISPVSRIVNTLDVIVKIFTGRAHFQAKWAANSDGGREGRGLKQTGLKLRRGPRGEEIRENPSQKRIVEISRRRDSSRTAYFRDRADRPLFFFLFFLFFYERGDIKSRSPWLRSGGYLALVRYWSHVISLYLHSRYSYSHISYDASAFTAFVAPPRSLASTSEVHDAQDGEKLNYTLFIEAARRVLVCALTI